MQDIEKPLKTKKNKLVYKKWWFWVLIVIALFIIWDVFIPKGSKEAKKETYSNEQIDVNGLTIKEACEKVREKGWTVSAVEGVNGGYVTERLDCSNESNKTTGVSYHTDKSIWDKPSVTLQFASSKAKEDTASSNSNSSSSTSSNSNSSSASTVSASFKKTMDSYETYMNKYVDFMKKYKANPSDATLLSEYSGIMSEYAKFADSISGIKEKETSTTDWAYYIEVTARVNKKLLEIQ